MSRKPVLIDENGLFLSPRVEKRLRRGIVNVKGHGAAGDGTTDDSGAIIAARTEVLNSAAGSALSKPTLYFPPGVYRCTQPDALYPAGGPHIRGYHIAGDGAGSSRVKFDPVGGSSTLTNMNLITTTGSNPHLWETRIEDIAFESTNPNASFGYFYSTLSNWNANSLISDVAFLGSWKRVFGLDGDSTANLNSEMRFYFVRFDDNTTFADAFLRSGITSPGSNAEQDQFLNYRFQDCDFSYQSGDCLVFDKGGQIIIDGGSWIIVGSAGGTHIKMGDYPHYDSVQFLKATGVRFELRSQQAKVIDCAWRAGTVTFDTCNDESSAGLYAINGNGSGATANWATHIYRTPQNTGPIVRYQSSALMGYHRVVTTATVPTPGKWIYNGCLFGNMQGGGVGLLSTATDQFLRHDSAQPKHRFQDCRWTTDANVGNP